MGAAPNTLKLFDMPFAGILEFFLLFGDNLELGIEIFADYTNLIILRINLDLEEIQLFALILNFLKLTTQLNLLTFDLHLALFELD